jgi:hypothetical protein
MAKKNFTRYFNITEWWEIYPNVCPQTRLLLNADGTPDPRNIKLPDGGVRLRFLGPVPKWYAQREKVYQEIFGPLRSNVPNPIEHLIQDKDNMFGGLYIMSDILYPEYKGAAYSGIATSTKMAKKNGNSIFGVGTLQRNWTHVMKLLGRHESVNVTCPEFWLDHVQARKDRMAPSDLSDVKFSFFIDYEHAKEELEAIEDALADHRLGKHGAKFPVNRHPASPLTDFGDTLPI